MEILAKFTGCEKRLAKEREERTGSTVPRLQNCLMRITNKQRNKQRENPLLRQLSQQTEVLHSHSQSLHELLNNKEDHNSLLVFSPKCVSCVPCKGNQNMLISLVFYFIAGNPKFVAGAHIGKVSARLKLCNEQNFGKKNT